MVKVKEDITGWNMWEHGVEGSRLTVLEQTDDYVRPNGEHVAMWLCECNCNEHKQIKVRGYNLKNGSTKSCGCLRTEQAIKKCINNKKTNKYSLLKDYGILWTTNTNEEVYFNLNDAEKILQHSWYKDSEGYASTHIGKTKVRMHTFLGYYRPDHRNRNKLDNRSDNLISCTIRENNINASIRSDNSSGIIGVYFNILRLRWVAQINDSENHTKNLGSFINKEDAIRVRLEAEAKCYGESAPQRHLFEQYKINVNNGDTDDYDRK